MTKNTKDTKTITASQNTVSYTQLSDELASLMAQMESGDLDVDTAVKCYARGLIIVKELETHLLNAENQVNELRDEFDPDKVA